MTMYMYMPTDPNFPRTPDGGTLHLGIKAGEVANRVITCGLLSRVQRIATFLDKTPRQFSLHSERGFLTITGKYRGTPVSLVYIGMGGPNVDFFIREVRAYLTGDMLVVRLGTCGCLTDLPIGSLVVPKASTVVTRNLNYDFQNGDPENEPYFQGKTVYADDEMTKILANTLDRPACNQEPIVPDVMNASADSFYSSQGRVTSFLDHSTDVVPRLKATVPDLKTFEMETYWVLHLAKCWRAPSLAKLSGANGANGSTREPESEQPKTAPSIRAAAVQMVVASREHGKLITPEQYEKLVDWSGRGVLEALRAVHIPSERLHPDEGSVWA